MSTQDILVINNIDVLINWSIITDEESIQLKSKIHTSILQHLNIDISNEFKMGIERIPMNKELLLHGYGLETNTGYRIEVTARGILSRLYECKPIDTDTIDKQCQLQTFPMSFTQTSGVAYQLHVDKDGVRLLNVTTNIFQSIKLQPLWTSAHPSHEPLHPTEETDEEWWTKDRYLSDTDIQANSQQHAFIMTRYAWGLNIGVAILDISESTIYYWYVANHDHPEGRAVRKTDTCVEIYLDNDEIDRRVLYTNTTIPVLPCIWNMYENSKWKPFPYQLHLDELQQFIAFVRAHPEEQIDNCLDYLKRSTDAGEEAYNNRDYAEAIVKYGQVLKTPFSEQQRNFFTRTLKNDVVKYNLMCCHALLGQSELALQYLRDIEPRWKEWKHLKNDTDLIVLQSNNEFQQILDKHLCTPETSNDK